MSVFRTATTPLQRIDPAKRVKYSLGLVLGVDEFDQEQGYFLERGRLQNRTLHGYGTVYGLKVTSSDDQISVAPGLAIDPLGREIRVGQSQCANLNDWLAIADNHPEMSAPTTLDIYVLLGYRECETDRVPVPGAPCRSEAENLVPSRITETFDLKFSLSLPNEREEAAVEAFGDLLRRIEVTDDYPEGTISVDDVPALVNGIDTAGGALRPKWPKLPIGDVRRPIRELPGDFYISPVRDNALRVRTADIEAVLDAMFRVWVTEVRPRILNEQTGPDAAPADQSVLLARLTVTVNDGWQTATVTVHEEERPYLLHTRLIQEYLLNREQSRDHDQLEGLDLDDHKQYLLVSPEDRSLIADLNAAGHKVVGLPTAENDGEAVPYEQAVKAGDSAGGDVAGTYRDKLRVMGIMGRPISDAPPQENNILVFNGKAWEPKPAAAGGGVSLHSLLQGLDNDDHKQYLLANGGRPLGGNLDANKKRIINLSQSVADGDPIVRGEGATGDLAGKYPAPTLAKLQGNTLDAAKPAAGQVLTYDGAKWTGMAYDFLNPVATQLPALPFVSVARIPSLPIGGPAYRLWFHLDPGIPAIIASIPVLQKGFKVHVFAEGIDKNSGQPTLGELPVTNVGQVDGQLNVFDVDLAPDVRAVDNLRFSFEIDTLMLTDGTNLAEYFGKQNIKYLGHDGRKLITAYWSTLTGPDLTQPRVVAAGAVDREGRVTYGNFQCQMIYDPTHGGFPLYQITFPGYDPAGQYIVKGSPVLVQYENQPELPIFCTVQLASGYQQAGILVKLARYDTQQPMQAPFMIEVAELPARSSQ